jgi:predicted DCC family thiol-disulfide oxidoreductase YuxK
MSQPTLTLFFDGHCPLCSREIAHYRRRLAGDAEAQFIDITDPHFCAQAHGLDPKKVHRLMHVKLGEQVLIGLDAFVAVWRRTPGYSWLASAGGVPGLHGLMKAGYHLFARVRPWLPRRRRCAAGACSR